LKEKHRDELERETKKKVKFPRRLSHVAFPNRGKEDDKLVTQRKLIDRIKGETQKQGKLNIKVLASSS